jgi:hypothetical protein
MMTDRFPDLPDRMRRLPVDSRGIVVPWFVAWVDGEPQFPVVDASKLTRAHRLGLCWVCGEKLGRYRASVIGPMCAINRTISEPQSHVECARFSARRCPFLSQPRMGRVPDAKLPNDKIAPAGLGLKRNPGVAAVWIETCPTMMFRVGDGYLFQLGEPHAVEWWCEGREATRAEVAHSIDTGLEHLVAACLQEAPGSRREAALVELATRAADNERLLPA